MEDDIMINLDSAELAALSHAILAYMQQDGVSDEEKHTLADLARKLRPYLIDKIREGHERRDRLN